MAQASAKKLEHTGSIEKERVASVPQVSSWQGRTSRPLPKRKRTESYSRSIAREVVESQGERELNLGEKD